MSSASRHVLRPAAPAATTPPLPVVPAALPSRELVVLAWPESREQDVAAAAARVRDWPAFLQRARVENVLGLVAARLRSERPAVVPVEVLAQVARAQGAVERVAIEREGQLLRVIALLESAGVQVMPVKGPALSQDVYGAPALRTYTDLDLLVWPQDALHARQVLLEHGHRDARPFTARLLAGGLRREGEVCLASPQAPAEVDLHWRLSAGAGAKAFTLEDLLHEARALPFHGRTVLAPGVADQLLLGVVHGARHDWCPLELRLATALQVSRLPEDAWPALCERAREHGSLRRLLVGIGHACAPFGVPVPAEVRRRVAHDRLAPAYAAHLRRAAHMGVRPPQQSTTAEYLGWLLWRVGAEDHAIASVEHFVVRAALPGPEDWAAVALPPALEPLYWALRPFRLALRYAGIGGPREPRDS